MSQKTHPAVAQGRDRREEADEKTADAPAATAAGERRLKCLLADAAPGLINGIRFATVEDGLFSEAITPEHEEQAARLCRVPEFVNAVVTPELTAAIDTALEAVAAAEAAAPAAPQPALSAALVEQQEINVAVSAERDQFRAEVQRLREQMAATDVKVMEADIAGKAKRIADLGTDVERLTAKVVALTEASDVKDLEVAELRAANESLGKQLEK